MTYEDLTAEDAITDRCGCWSGSLADEAITDGCDVCHRHGFEISAEAIRTHLRPEHATLAGPGFRFCASEWCPIVYFNPMTELYFAHEDVLPVGKYKSDYSLRRDRRVYTDLETKTFKVGGITCADCITHIARSVKQLPGAQKISGNLTDNTVKVRFEPDNVSVEQIIQAIESAGYEVEGVLA